MRKEFIEAANYSAAARKAPWAAIIARCEGGYIAFESRVDYRTWKTQR